MDLVLAYLPPVVLLVGGTQGTIALAWREASMIVIFLMRRP
jgi:hypothetical protein